MLEQNFVTKEVNEEGLYEIRLFCIVDKVLIVVVCSCVSALMATGCCGAKRLGGSHQRMFDMPHAKQLQEWKTYEIDDRLFTQGGKPRFGKASADGEVSESRQNPRALPRVCLEMMQYVCTHGAGGM
jgi:hypothetical protein